jgi:cytosine/adenosine deaminase-related metal-dependent hydrolase
MRITHRTPIFLASLSMTLVLAGCASEAPQPPQAPKIVSGDLMMRDSQGIAQLGSRWQEGKQMMDKGQALQRQGQTEIEQGQSLINEGQKIMRESEEGYKNIKQ